MSVVASRISCILQAGLHGGGAVLPCYSVGDEIKLGNLITIMCLVLGITVNNLTNK